MLQFLSRMLTNWQVAKLLSMHWNRIFNVENILLAYGVGQRYPIYLMPRSARTLQNVATKCQVFP